MKGLLLSQMHPWPGRDGHFHEWYERQEIPAMLNVPGFVSAHRYRAVEGGPGYLSCYYADDMSAFADAQVSWLARGLTRYVCEETSDTGPSVSAPAELLYLLAFAVPRAEHSRFEQWYRVDHVPHSMAAGGCARVRGYTVRPSCDGPPWTHFAVHEVSDGPRLPSPPDKRSPGLTGRWLYRPIYTALGAEGLVEPPSVAA